MILAVDGHSIGSRAFYSGKNYFFSMIAQVAKEARADRIVVAFDGPNNFRKEIYPSYKDRDDEARDKRVALLRSYYIKLNRAGFTPTVIENAEADDVLNTVAINFPGATTLLTGDKDLWSLYPFTDVVYIGGSFSDRKIIDGNAWDSKYGGIFPEYFADYKGLAGEASDTIPGVKGIGPKRARRLIKEFGTLEDIYKALKAGAIKPEHIAEKLERDENWAFLSRELAAMIDVGIENVNIVDYNSKLGRLQL